VGPAWITIHDSSTLQQAGSIYPEGFEGRWVSQARAVPRIALTAGDSLVTASSEKGELVWWDLDTGRREKTLEIDHGYGGYRALGRSPDGRTVAVGLSRGFGLVDVRTGAVRRARGARVLPIALVFSPDGGTVVSTNVDGTVAVWDAETATLVDTLHGHSRAVWQGVFSPDGKTLYTAGADGTAIAWAQGGAHGLVRRQFTFTHDRGLRNWPDIHPGGLSTNGVIAVGLEDRGIGIFDLDNLSEPSARLLDTPGEVKALAISPDGHTVVALSNDAVGERAGLGATATVWDVESRSLRYEPIPVPGEVLRFGLGFVSLLGISEAGTLLALPDANGVRLRDLATGAPRGHIGKNRGVETFAFGRDGLVAITFYGGLTEVWDIDTKARIASLYVESVAYPTGQFSALSPDGRTLATGGLSSLVNVWDVRTGRLVREIEHNVGAAIWALEFSPDGKVLAISGGDGFASLWDVASGAQIGPRFGVGGREALIDLSSDGRRLLMTNGDGTGAVWDIDPESWARRACALANRTLTREEWKEFLPGRPYEPACR
jgi:WD40 repeat protein